MDTKYADGASATFAALTAPSGASLLTTTLAKLAFVGLGVQALALLGTRIVPAWSPLLVAAGSSLFLAFWDLDNWILVDSLFMLAGFVPMVMPTGLDRAGHAQAMHLLESEGQSGEFQSSMRTSFMRPPAPALIVT